MLPAVIMKLRTWLKPPGERNATRIHRRRKLIHHFWQYLPTLIVVLLAVGYCWMLAIPWPTLGQRTYIDENALQPGQVNTYWNWDDVHRADRYLEALELLRDRNASSEEVAGYIAGEFQRAGIPADIQHFTFSTTSGIRSGVNAYAMFSSPRTSGTEAMVISASWLSRSGGDGTLNLRGISSVLSLAWFLRGYSLWAKDLIFVVSDGYMDGMQAWVTAYHGVSQANLQAESLRLTSGVIWTALNIDYPGHSFSHLGVFFEGLNGRLPNQDLINSFQRIAWHTGGVPVIVYDHQDTDNHLGLMSWFPDVKIPGGLQEYVYRAKNVMRHVGYQSRGQASGVHGLLHQFRIDAITLFAVPATGPHGYHAIGRVVESTLRTMNNLLERLHASFFFYLLVGPTTFLKIGTFLPSVILISVAMMFRGLREWVNAGWVRAAEGEKGEPTQTSVQAGRWTRRERPVLQATGIIVGTHTLGIIIFYLITGSMFVQSKLHGYLIMLFVPAMLSLSSLYLPSSQSTKQAPLSTMLKSLNLCLASTIISIMSVLNFSLAAVMAFVTGLPLCCASTSPYLGFRVSKYAAYAILALGWIVLQREATLQAVWNWEILRIWFAPFVCIVYTPLVLQAALVCLMPSET